ncbi:MAG: hypothetical protein PW788_09925 [Micavibrio sp.]|nr:hypothetical protein [Micavibrio sp.]
MPTKFKPVEMAAAVAFVPLYPFLNVIAQNYFWRVWDPVMKGIQENSRPVYFLLQILFVCGPAVIVLNYMMRAEKLLFKIFITAVYLLVMAPMVMYANLIAGHLFSHTAVLQ